MNNSNFPLDFPLNSLVIPSQNHSTIWINYGIWTNLFEEIRTRFWTQTLARIYGEIHNRNYEIQRKTILTATPILKYFSQTQHDFY